MRILVTGDCQSEHLAAMLRLVMCDADVTQLTTVHHGQGDRRQLAGHLDEADVWIRQQIPQDAWAREHARPATRVIEHPPVLFDGFHPDITVAIADGRVLPSFSPYSSRIGLWGWRTGLSPAQTADLFAPEVFARLGYLHRWTIAAEELRSAYAQSDIRAERMWSKLLRGGPFMHTWNHPTLEYFSLLARAIAETLEPNRPIDWDEPLADLVTDTSNGAVWPVYPAIAQHLGVPGSYRWRNGADVANDLEEYLRLSWLAYGDTDPRTVESVAPDAARIDTVLAGFMEIGAERETESIGLP